MNRLWFRCNDIAGCEAKDIPIDGLNATNIGRFNKIEISSESPSAKQDRINYMIWATLQPVIGLAELIDATKMDSYKRPGNPVWEMSDIWDSWIDYVISEITAIFQNGSHNFIWGHGRRPTAYCNTGIKLVKNLEGEARLQVRFDTESYMNGKKVNTLHYNYPKDLINAVDKLRAHLLKSLKFTLNTAYLRNPYEVDNKERYFGEQSILFPSWGKMINRAVKLVESLACIKRFEYNYLENSIYFNLASRFGQQKNADGEPKHWISEKSYIQIYDDHHILMSYYPWNIYENCNSVIFDDTLETVFHSFMDPMTKPDMDSEIPFYPRCSTDYSDWVSENIGYKRMFYIDNHTFLDNKFFLYAAVPNSIEEKKWYLDSFFNYLPIHKDEWEKEFRERHKFQVFMEFSRPMINPSKEYMDICKPIFEDVGYNGKIIGRFPNGILKDAVSKKEYKDVSMNNDMSSRDVLLMFCMLVAIGAIRPDSCIIFSNDLIKKLEGLHVDMFFSAICALMECTATNNGILSFHFCCNQKAMDYIENHDEKTGLPSKYNKYKELFVEREDTMPEPLSDKPM